MSLVPEFLCALPAGSAQFGDIAVMHLGDLVVRVGMVCVKALQGSHHPPDQAAMQLCVAVCLTGRSLQCGCAFHAATVALAVARQLAGCTFSATRTCITTSKPVSLPVAVLPSPTVPGHAGQAQVHPSWQYSTTHYRLHQEVPNTT
jgi:hypothetical protein